MRSIATLSSGTYEFFTPEHDQDFNSIVELNRAVHGDGAAALCHSLRRHHPGMQDSYWYGLRRPGERELLSTLCLIPGVWTYRSDKTDLDTAALLPVAEMGLVATTEPARGLGLSSWLIRRFMRDARNLGFLLSGIQGIPYFYHRFGYEYAVPLLVKQQLTPDTLRQVANQTRVAYRLRPAGPADIPLLETWHRPEEALLELTHLRTTEHWQYLTSGALESPETAIERLVVLEPNGTAIGYLGIQHDCFGPTLAVVEAGLPNASCPADLYLTVAEQLRNDAGLPHVSLLLPEAHPLMRRAAALSGKTASSYGWQVAILDSVALLGRLVPVLQARLTQGGWATTPFEFRLGQFGQDLLLRWDCKQLRVEAQAQVPADSTGRSSDGSPLREDAICADAASTADTAQPTVARFAAEIPPELLSPLVLGFRSVAELALCRLDLSADTEARKLLDCLFPVMRTYIYPCY